MWIKEPQSNKPMNSLNKLKSNSSIFPYYRHTIYFGISNFRPQSVSNVCQMSTLSQINNIFTKLRKKYFLHSKLNPIARTYKVYQNSFTHTGILIIFISQK